MQVFLLQHSVNKCQESRACAIAEKSASGIFAGSDKRIGKAPINNVTEDRLDTVRVPRIEPHYCRANTTMQYLSPELSISKLYDLYVNDFCVRNQVDNPATQSINQSTKFL